MRGLIWCPSFFLAFCFVQFTILLFWSHATPSSVGAQCSRTGCAKSASGPRGHTWLPGLSIRSLWHSPGHHTPTVSLFHILLGCSFLGLDAISFSPLTFASGPSGRWPSEACLWGRVALILKKGPPLCYPTLLPQLKWQTTEYLIHTRAFKFQDCLWNSLLFPGCLWG